jgi:arylformamidase
MAMAKIDYEAEYDTRVWSPGFEEVFARREADAAAYREEMQRSGRAELGVRYGASERQFVDIFSPAQAAAGEPLAVFIHGGYWRAQTPATYSNLARGLNAHGVTVAMVGYDLCPAVTIADIIEQVRAGCRFLWGRYRKRMLVLGHSAGGHLTSCMVATDWKALDPHVPEDLVPAGYAISGIFELEPLLATSLNADLRLDPQTAERLSPILWDVPPGRILDVVEGGAESPEFLRQSETMAEAWRQDEAETRYEPIPGKNHFTVIEALADPDSAMVRRLLTLSGRVQAGDV